MPFFSKTVLHRGGYRGWVKNVFTKPQYKKTTIKTVLNLINHELQLSVSNISCSQNRSLPFCLSTGFQCLGKGIYLFQHPLPCKSPSPHFLFFFSIHITFSLSSPTKICQSNCKKGIVFSLFYANYVLFSSFFRIFLFSLHFFSNFTIREKNLCLGGLPEGNHTLDVFSRQKIY